MLGYRHMTRNTTIEDDVEPVIGRQPRPDGFEDEASYREAVREYMESLKETEQYGEWYDRAIEPTLDIARHVGNWYTGSVHIARVSALRRAHENGIDATGEQLLVGSYGSGAQAEIHIETVQEEWERELDALDIDDQLDARRDISFAEYEDIHDAHNHAKDDEFDALTTPETEFVRDGQGPMNERTYRYVE